MAQHLEVHDEILLKPGQDLAFDCSDPELVAVFNELQDLIKAMGQVSGNVFGCLRLPFMIWQKNRLEKRQLGLERRDYLRTKYHNGSRG